MPTPGGMSRNAGQERGVEHDHEHVPEGHYRGRGNDQSDTGPAGSALEQGSGRFMTKPSGGAEENPSGGRWPSQDTAGEPPSGRHFGVGPKGYARPDARVHEDVCEAMTDHGDLDASEIEVAVLEGEVTLRGTVRDRHAKFLAENLATAVRGVREVRNELRLAPERGQAAEETYNELYGSSGSESGR